MSEDEANEDNWEMSSDDEMFEDIHVTCLFCGIVNVSVGESMKHCRRDHSFDIREFILKSVSTHYDLVKLITYLRRHKPTVEDLVSVNDEKPWDSDVYLHPVFPDDPWLWADEGLVIDNDEDVEPKYVNAENGVVTLSKEHFDELQEKNQRLELLLKEQGEKIDSFRKLLDEEPLPMKTLTDDDINDDSYFDSYSDFEIHREMLKDSQRMLSYKEAIDPSIFLNKTVLDVGCGTGILSMMAASAGAKRVVGVENSDIFDAAVEIVRDNKLDGKITLIKGDIENIEINESFDIIISEWMGYFLLFERMLESIIIARQKYLKEGGLMLPSSCRLWLAGCSDPVGHSDRINCHVLGYKMDPLCRAALSEAAVESVPSDKIATEPVLIHTIVLSDQNLTSNNCCSFENEFILKVKNDCELTSICGWFDSLFEPTKSILSTSPFNKPTHWAQTTFYLKDPIKVEAGNILPGKLKVSPEGNRSLQICLELPSANMKRVYTLH